MKDIVRRVRFTPYVEGPRFSLIVWDANRRDELGKWILGYRLTMCEPSGRTVLFEAEDFHCSPLHAVDADETIASLMTFLTLRPGDTDREYFDRDTSNQVDYRVEHAEALGVEVDRRMGVR